MHYFLNNKISLFSGIRLGQALMETKHMHNLGTKPLKRTHPHCKKLPYDSDAYWECYIRHNTLTLFHPVGTCKMGGENDSTAVVDPTLRHVHLQSNQQLGQCRPTLKCGCLAFFK